MENRLKFNTTISNFEKVNPNFTKATSKVAYTDLNRNNSFISKEAFEKSMYSIFNIPIVGEYDEENDNFKGHGGMYEVVDGKVVYKDTTKPYGVVSSDADIYWEEIEEKDGSINSYLVVDGIQLWTERYKELDVLLEYGHLNQSMEIEVVKGQFEKINGESSYKIDEFIFTGLCLLGIDKNGENPEQHVEPAFESADVRVSYESESFQLQFNKMLEELEFSKEKGGNDLTKEIKEEVVEEKFEQVEETVVDEVVEEKVETTDEVKEETNEVVEVFEEKVQEVVVAEEVTTDEVVQFSITEEEYNTQVANFEAEKSALLSELNELREFKRKSEESELVSKFTDKLSTDEISEVLTASKEFSIEQVEEKLLVLFAKKNFSMSKENDKPVSKVNIQYQKNDEEYNPYKAFFSKD